MRQVKDKRYWMALLQSKIQEILQEMEKLKKEKKNLDRETSAKKLYEKKVKEQAKELSSNYQSFSKRIFAGSMDWNLLKLKLNETEMEWANWQITLICN